MTLDELRERIKNELVLHEGNVADWQWTRTGLPAEAAEQGITDFLRLVDDVSRSLNAQFGKILDLQALIRKVATDNQKRLSDVQIGGFALDAERLGLSRAFVVDQWVPRLLAQLPDATTPDAESPVVTTPNLPPVTPAAPATVSSGAVAETAETMQQKVRAILDDYKEHIPAPAIRALFRAINYDEKALADAVLAYLTANFYASEKEPQGSTLREKLISTDWRHLVWWDRPAQPVSVPTSTKPVQTGTPATGTSAPTPVKSSSGWRDFLVALLIAGGLIGFVVVLVKSNGTSSKAADEPNQTEQADVRREVGPTKPAKSKRKRRTKTQQEATRNSDTEATATGPSSPRKAAYDELLNDVGQYGERPARKDGQWGLWRKGKWLIPPDYDEIGVFSEGRAHVTINGNSYDIDRQGDRIR